MKQKTSKPVFNQACSQWAGKLNPIHQDDLSYDERIELQKHLSECHRCQELTSEYTAQDALITNLPPVESLAGIPEQLSKLIGISDGTLQTSSPKNLQEMPFVPEASLKLPPSTRKFRRRHSILPLRRLNQVAAVLVVGIILGGFLLLMIVHHSSNIATQPQMRIYIANDSSITTLYALNPESGATIWQREMWQRISSPLLVSNGYLYLSMIDGNVAALRISDGQLLWRIKVTITAHATPNTSLLTFQNLIFTGTSDGYLVAINAHTGSIIWHKPVPGCTTFNQGNCSMEWGPLSQANGIIYTLTDKLYAWNATNGQIIWQNPQIQRNGQPQSLIATQNKLYMNLPNNILDVFDAKSGHLMHRLSLGGSSTILDLAFNESNLYVLGNSSIATYRLSDDSLLWQRSFGPHSTGSINIIGENIYITYNNIYFGFGSKASSDLYALASNTGSQRWSWHKEIQGTGFKPIGANGIVCLSTLKGLYGYDASNGHEIWYTFQNQLMQGPVAG